MKKLIEILKKETRSLKNQYISFTEKWAKNEFIRLKAIKEIDIINERGWKNRIGKMEHTKASDSYWNNIRRIISKGQDYFIKDAILNAEEHYEGSILKLAARINQKGLNVDSLKVKTSHIGINIETTLTDSKKTVKAFTILAGGDIQRPHYRYLIK